MDTDKKRKTIRCQKCGLTFSGERVYCPLCKKRIIDEGTEDSSIKEDFDVFPVTQKKQADFIFMKIVTFAALAAVIVAGMVDRMMVLSDRTWQPIFFLVVIGVAGGYALLIVVLFLFLLYSREYEKARWEVAQKYSREIV